MYQSARLVTARRKFFGLSLRVGAVALLFTGLGLQIMPGPMRPTLHTDARVWELRRS